MIKFGKLKIRFYNFGNGYIRIGKLKIKLIPSTNKKLPATKGWVYFRFGKLIYYLNFKKVFTVLIFGKCKKTILGLKGFCGKASANKGIISS